MLRNRASDQGNSESPQTRTVHVWKYGLLQTRQTKVRAGQYGTIEGVFVGSNPPWIHTVTGDPAPQQEKWSNSECVASELDSI